MSIISSVRVASEKAWPLKLVLGQTLVRKKLLRPFVDRQAVDEMTLQFIQGSVPENAQTRHCGQLTSGLIPTLLTQKGEGEEQPETPLLR